MALGLGPPRPQVLKDGHESAAHLESTPTGHVGSASLPVGGSLPHIELGDALSPQAGSQRDEVVDVDVDVSQDGQALPSSIETSHVLATVHTEEFSSSTPQGSSEDPSHPPDTDTTSPSTQPPRPRDNQLRLSQLLGLPRFQSLLLIVYDHISTICAIIQRLFRQNKL